MKEKIRIDEYLKRKYLMKEELIRSYILRGLVKKNHKKITRINELVKQDDVIEIESIREFPSRSAFKLLEALEKLDLKEKIKNRICMDIGCSHGGFTKVLLDHQAKKIYAIDVARGIFDYSLRNSKQILLFEEKNIKDLELNDFNFVDFMDYPWFITCDVSFLSLITVLKKLKELLKQIQIRNREFWFEGIFLIKPQFEASKLTTGGIIRDEQLRREIVEKTLKKILEMEYKIISNFPCSLKGAKGNTEEIVYISSFT